MIWHLPAFLLSVALLCACATPYARADEFETDDTLAPPAGLSPLRTEGASTVGGGRDFSRYACAEDKDESGPERVHTLTITRLGLLRVRVLDDEEVDVDVHLLSGDGPESCVTRGDERLEWVVRPGIWKVVVDTFVDARGRSAAGDYRLELDFLPLDEGPCAVRDEVLEMGWKQCSPGIDCRDDGVRSLMTPSMGRVAREAHLVTEGEGFESDWPGALRDGIESHYQRSEEASGYRMTRREGWAPAGEGGSRWGQGATGVKLPRLDEAWYVNMRWKKRPLRGVRMLILEPVSGRAVVAAGGWETGPGPSTAIGGVSEEIHDYLGTTHGDRLVVGFLVDDDAPLGPIPGGCGGPR